MTISTGDRLPSATLFHMQDGEYQSIDSDSVLGQGKVVLFALPGAYTPTCSAAHLPGYVVHADAILAAGIDRIVCLSVNDGFVMGAWGKDHNVEDKVLMLGDGVAELTKAMGLEVDLTERGLGIRSQRYAMLINDGVVEHLALEAPGQFEVSDAESMLKVIKGD